MELVAGAGGALVVLSTGYLLLTIVLSRFDKRRRADGPEITNVVFLVPALDEERVIVPTVESLLQVEGARVLVLVIDDGSDDGTGALVASSFDDPRLHVLRRSLPAARQGKGAALNAGYQLVRRLVLTQGADPDRTIVAIVDADGRLPPGTVAAVRPYFRHRRTGAVQLQVRIRNRHQLIGRLQDYEFLLFSSITQTAREHLGSVGLGGNGQFTRLSALMTLGDEPWSDCLTEDLDLGLRLALGGWQNRFCSSVAVDQQGVDSVSKLIRQRTRWMQGHFQCWKLLPRIVRSELPTLTVLDLCYYLISPSLALLGSIVYPLPLLVLVGSVAWSSGSYLGSVDGLLYLGALYLLSFGPVLALAFVYRRRSRDATMGQAIGLAHVLTLHSWVWYVAEWKAIVRLLRRRGGWAKTERAVELVVATPP